MLLYNLPGSDCETVSHHSWSGSLDSLVAHSPPRGTERERTTDPQNSSTDWNEMTFERASSHDFALSCLLAESNQSVHGEYSGCLTLKFSGSDRTVTSSLSFEGAIAVLTAAWDACAAAAGRFDEGARGDFVGASDMLGLRGRTGRG